MRSTIRAAMGLSLGLAIAAGAVLWGFHMPASDEIVRYVPSDAAAYVHLYLRPSTQQRMAIRDLLERLPVDADSVEELKEMLGRLLDPALKVSGMTYRHDVAGWLGNQMGFFALPNGAGRAVILDIKEGESEAARRASERALRDRPRIAAETVSDVLIIGDRSAVEVALAFDSGDGDASLVQDAGYLESIDPLPDDRTLTVYAQEDGLDIAATGWARSDGVAFDISVPGRSPAELTPADLSALLDRLDSAGILPLERFGGLIRNLDSAAPEVLTALRFAGVIGDGGDIYDWLLGNGYESSLVFDSGRLEDLAGVVPILETLPRSMRALVGSISHIVLGTRSDGTIRLFIGVK